MPYPDTAVNVVAVWLFNPFTAPIGTRGNCEAVVGALILFVVHSLITSRIVLAALAYGLAVHLRYEPSLHASSLKTSRRGQRFATISHASGVVHLFTVPIAPPASPLRLHNPCTDRQGSAACMLAPSTTLLAE
jgi:hypothetical protein